MLQMVEEYLKANKMFRDFKNTAEDPAFSEVS